MYKCASETGINFGDKSESYKVLTLNSFSILSYVIRNKDKFDLYYYSNK